MTINIEVISTEMIKPSTPTPHHLRHYQFSFLDQTAPPIYNPFIYFFNNDQKLTSNDMSKLLKLSLSKLLTRYYPLAGCVKENHVDCNDDGVLFLETKVSCQLSQIMEEPVRPSKLNKLLPYLHKQDINVINNLALAIQVNFFNCGGVAIGTCIYHKIADGSSSITVFKNWAATARGDTNNICPEFVASTLFPPKDLGGFDTNIRPTEKNVVLKRFVFSGSTIAALREKYADTRSSLNKGMYPTRVEALSSFIWSRFVTSTQLKLGPERTYMLVHAVNIRKRMDQSLSDDSFGNIYGRAITVSSESFTGECYGLVNKFRDAISKINKDYVKKLQDSGNEVIGSIKAMAEKFNKGELFIFNYSSFCRYPVYEADFGWGRPTWVAFGGFPYTNLVVLMDTKCGDGIEAWIHLKPEDMAKFEADNVLLAYVSPTYNA